MCKIYQSKKKAKNTIAYERGHKYLMTLNSKNYQIKNEIQGILKPIEIAISDFVFPENIGPITISR